VIGVPDPILGMAIKAVIALTPEARLIEQDVIRHCAKHLEDFMVPKQIEFRDDLPKTESGKISRPSDRGNAGGDAMTLPALQPRRTFPPRR
jgi:acyl-coenzyme A synthetase/AMP-(fatty) acid ligase